MSDHTLEVCWKYTYEAKADAYEAELEWQDISIAAENQGEKITLNRYALTPNGPKIDATVEEFKQNGLKFTMNDLAKRLGISKKTIYTVFESKQAVLVAVADRYAADLYSMQEELEADVSLNVVQKLEKQVLLSVLWSQMFCTRMH